MMDLQMSTVLRLPSDNDQTSYNGATMHAFRKRHSVNIGRVGCRIGV